MIRILAIILALVSPAFAQSGAPVKQSGFVTPGHVPMWTTNGIIQDGGTAFNGFLTSLGVTAQGPGICQNSAPPTSAGWQRICLGVTTAGGAEITAQNFGTAPALPLTLNLNGINYQFPFSVGGVVGPVTTIVGDLALWNNTQGTLLSDGGPPVLSVGNTDGSLTFSPTTGHVIGSVNPLGNQYFGSGRPWCDIRARGALGSAGASVSVNVASPAIVTWTANGLVANQKITFLSGTVPTGLSLNTDYYAINPTTNTTELATTASGSPINTTGSPSSAATAGADDHAAIAACVTALINLQPSIGAGTIFFPVGNYCDFEGTNVSGLNNGFWFVGTGNGSIWDNCGHDVTTLALGGLLQSFVGLFIQGENSPATTHPAVSIGSGCGGSWTCLARDDVIKYGSPAISVEGQLTMEHVRIINSYSDYVYATGGLYAYNNQIDQPGPPGGCAFPSAASLNIGSIAWASATPYLKCAVVSINAGQWYLMATVAGTSGSGAPTAMPYGVPELDTGGTGTLTWELWVPGQTASNNCAGVHIASGPNIFLFQNDISGAYCYNVLVDGSATTVDINSNTFGFGVSAFIDLKTGSNAHIKGNTGKGCIGTDCSGILIGAAYSGDAMITENLIDDNYYGIYLASGPLNTIISSNTIAGNVIGLNTANGAQTWKAVGNSFYSAIDGANTTHDVLIGSTNDYFNGIANNCSAGGLSNGSSGATHGVFGTNTANAGC